MRLKGVSQKLQLATHPHPREVESPLIKLVCVGLHQPHLIFWQLQLQRGDDGTLAQHSLPRVQSLTVLLDDCLQAHSLMDGVLVKQNHELTGRPRRSLRVLVSQAAGNELLIQLSQHLFKRNIPEYQVVTLEFLLSGKLYHNK